MQYVIECNDYNDIILLEFDMQRQNYLECNCVSKEEKRQRGANLKIS
jgi:hypothetical protein